MICNKRCCHPAKALQLSGPDTVQTEIHLTSSRCEHKNDWLCLMYSFRLNKGNVFPKWLIAAPYSCRLHLSDWSYTVTPTLCTCQEPPEQSRDEWGWVKEPDVEVRRAAAWNKRGSTTKPRVKRPCCFWKRLSCCWQGATAVCSLPCKRSYWHPEAMAVTLHGQICS